jgi:hypothetical protein
VLSINEPNIDDTATGKLSRNIIAAFDQHYSDQLSERMQKSARSTLEAGRWGRSAPLGYNNEVKRTPGSPNIVPDEARASFIRRAFELVASGNHTTAEVLRVVNAEGFTTRRNKPVPMQTFIEMLKNPVYIGLQRSRKYGETLPGLWSPLVDTHTFKNVQSILAGKKPTNVPHARNHPHFPLRGTLLCEKCGQPLTGGDVTGKGGKKYPYYWCRTSGCRAVKNIPAKRIEAEFVELLNHLRSTSEFRDRFLPELELAWRASSKERIALIAQAEAELKEQKSLLKKLLTTFLKGDIDKQTYHGAKKDFEDSCDGYEEFLTELNAREGMTTLFWQFSRHVLLDLSQAWKRASLDQKQNFQKILFRGGLTYSSDSGILNTDKDSLFSKLDGFMSDYLSLASPTGFEPVLSP